MPTARTQDVVYNSYIGYDYSLSLDSQLGCNLENTPILSTLPQTATPSTGTYLFKSKGDTIILNASGSTSDAKIKLAGVSSTAIPSTFLTADHTGSTAIAHNAYASDPISGAPLTSSLTATKLLFGSTDYKALVDLHSTQISNLSAVDVTELAKLSDLDNVDQALKSRLTIIEDKQPIIISIPIHNVQSVFADSSGRVDYIPASVSSVTPYTGFYYKNNLNEKVNWYIQPDIGLTVGDLKGLMLNFYNVSSTSGSGCPFVSVYTKPDSSSPNATSWYKSRKTFMVDYVNVIPSINTSYALLADLKGLTYSPQAWGHTKTTAITIPGNDKGSFADGESILFFSIGTSSNAQAGLFEFIASKFTVLTANASTEFVFQQL